jgi:hypothetical protein
VISNGIGQRQDVPVLDEGVLRSEVDAGPRLHRRCIGQGYAVVPTPPGDDIGVRMESLRSEHGPNLVRGSPGKKCLNDRCSERLQALLELVQETPKLSSLFHRP